MIIKSKLQSSRKNPVLKDTSLGEVTQPISLSAARAQPNAYQDMMLVLQNAGKVEGKVHVQCRFQ